MTRRTYSVTQYTEQELRGCLGGAKCGLGIADDVDEEDRRPTQRRRIMEEAQAGGFDENMEPLVRPKWKP